MEILGEIKFLFRILEMVNITFTNLDVSLVKIQDLIQIVIEQILEEM